VTLDVPVPRSSVQDSVVALRELNSMTNVKYTVHIQSTAHDSEAEEEATNLSARTAPHDPNSIVPPHSPHSVEQSSSDWFAS
jgi:hypothetical protein